MPPCPDPAPCAVTDGPVPRPDPYPKRRSGAALAVSLTLPGDHRSTAMARGMVTVALRAHGLVGYLWPAVLVAAELVSVSATMTPGRELYLSLRHRDDALRLLLWDQHPPHATPVVAAGCEALRLRSLWLLKSVVDDWGGKWGVHEAELAPGGTKSWVVLPR